MRHYDLASIYPDDEARTPNTRTDITSSGPMAAVGRLDQQVDFGIVLEGRGDRADQQQIRIFILDLVGGAEGADPGPGGDAAAGAGRRRFADRPGGD
jgi:hypothetical protein